MSLVTNQRVRIAVDTASMQSVLDALTGNSPSWWNGVDLELELALFRAGALVDISNLSTITADLKVTDSRTGLPLMSKTLSSGSLNQALTLEQWNGGAPGACHALLKWTHQETNLDLSDDQVTFWLVISGLTNDTPAHLIVFGAGAVTVVEAGEGVTPPAYVVEPTYYTAAQSDARYTQSLNLTTINNEIAALETAMTAVQGVANAALPQAGGTLTGPLTITGLSGVLKATAGLVSGSATTTDLTEGANLYFTNARADARITAASGAVSGICPLDINQLIPPQYLPPLAIVSTSVVASQAAMLALVAQQGDVAIRTDINQTFILSTNSPGTLADWKQVLTPASAVVSVNGFTGAVSLSTTNIGEGTNKYYTTARAQADALAALLAGFSNATGGLVTSGDSILSALGRHEYRMVLNDAKLTGGDRVKLDGSTAMTGMLNFTGTGHAGLQLNNLTDTQRAGLTPQPGMVIYNTTLSQMMIYNGAWQSIPFGGGSTILNGSGVPGGGLGADGNYYIDSTAQNIYLKTSGSWAIIVAAGMPVTGGTFTGTIVSAVSPGTDAIQFPHSGDTYTWAIRQHDNTQSNFEIQYGGAIGLQLYAPFGATTPISLNLPTGTISIGATKVIGAQLSGIALMDFVTGGVIDVQVRNGLNLVIAALRGSTGHGLIAG